MRHQDELMRLSHNVHGLSEEFLISYFVSGLKDTIKFELIAKHPTAIIEAMLLAKVEDEKETALKKT